MAVYNHYNEHADLDENRDDTPEMDEETARAVAEMLQQFDGGMTIEWDLKGTNDAQHH